MLKAESHCCIVWTFLIGWLGLRVNWGWVDSLSEEARVIEYFWLFGERESKTKKSIYSWDQILAFLELTRLLKGTATLEKIWLGACKASPGSITLSHTWLRTLGYPCEGLLTCRSMCGTLYSLCLFRQDLNHGLLHSDGNWSRKGCLVDCHLGLFLLPNFMPCARFWVGFWHLDKQARTCFAFFYVG